MQTNDAIRAIKERISIVDLVRRYVDLKPNGSRFTAPCPFHQETKPSFSVNPEEGFFYCFGCHASGDIFEFYSKINGLDFRECLEQLALEAGINLEARQWQKNTKSALEESQKKTERQQILRMHEVAAAFYMRSLSGAAGAECGEYIKKRGISDKILELFGLGWADRAWRGLAEELRQRGYDLELACEAGLLGRSSGGTVYDRFRGRLIFPIKNLSNQIIAFGGRIIGNEDEAKYINSSDTPIYKKKEHLYGLAQARRGITSRGMAILTEGYMDVLTLHQFGYENGVGVLGTSLTDEQIKRLGGFASRILLVFDGDAAGRKAALRSCEMLLTRGISCQVAHLPDGEDIDSFLRAYGCDAFDTLCHKAPDGLRYCTETLKDMAPKDAIDWAKTFIANIKIPELASPYATAFAHQLGLDENSLRDDLALRKKNVNGQSGSVTPMHDVRDKQIMIYAIRYPHRLTELRAIGADLALNSHEARELWHILETFGPDEAFYHLNEGQKIFWQAQRGPGAPPLDNCEYELACLKRELSSFYKTEQKSSLSAALAENSGAGNFEADLEYLRALQETLGNHGDKNE